MKDALGHGSNGSGDGTLVDQLRARLSHVSILKGGGIPQSSNEAAGAALMSVLGRIQAPPVINAPSATWNGLTSERASNRGLVSGLRNKGR